VDCPPAVELEAVFSQVMRITACRSAPLRWALAGLAVVAWYGCARGVGTAPAGGQGGGTGGDGGGGTASVSSSGTTTTSTSATSAPSGSGGAGGAVPSCGNGSIDAGEQCDDGNGDDADGCSGCVVDCEPTEFKHSTTHHCYRLVTTSERQQAAQNDCATWGGAVGLGYLVSITSADEQTFVQNIGAGNERWIGAGDAAVEGSFEWISGEPWSYTNWRNGEPSGGGEDCVEIENDGQWDDQPCDDQKWYVCERGAAGEMP
jgi:cysteine-rich repeat protein